MDLIELTSAECAVSDGGIRVSYVANCSDIATVTFDANSQITAFTMGSTGKWTKYEMDTETDTAYFNETGERQGKKHIYKQAAFMQFGGLDNTKRKAAIALTGNCCLIAIHYMNNGTARVQGLHQIGTSTSLFQNSKKKLVVTANLLSDTGANEDRAEFNLLSEARTPAHFTTLTEAAIEAL